MAKAQVIVGGNRLPAVSVNTSVLDRLGPPLTLPQLFLGGAGYAARPTATASRTPTQHSRTRHVAKRRAAPAARRVQVARAAPSSLNQIIHLIPPTPHVASAAPVRHDESAISEPTRPTVAALAAPATTMAAAPSVAPTPAPAPQPPQSRDSPTPPILPPQPASVAAPSTPVAPPTQSASAAPPPVAPPSASPPPFVAPSAVLAANAAPMAAPTVVASAAPSPGIAPAPAATASAPPVQMAAATTVGSRLSAIKFNAGATDLPAGPQPALDAIVARLLADDGLRVQVIAHATGGPDDAMEARRVSLARAVAVRAYLIAKGIRSLRIDVRALGNRADSGMVADQVDLMVLSQ